MVEVNSSFEYKRVKEASFGISYNFLRALNNDGNIHPLINQNINSFTKSFHCMISYIDNLTVICNNSPEKNQFIEDYVKSFNGKMPPQYFQNSYHRALVYAFANATTMAKAISVDQLDINKDRINILYAENSSEFSDFSSKNNVIHLNVEDIKGSDKNGNEGDNGYNSLFYSKALIARFDSKSKNKYHLNYFFRYLKNKSNYLIVYDPYMFVSKSREDRIEGGIKCKAKVVKTESIKSDIIVTIKILDGSLKVGHKFICRNQHGFTDIGKISSIYDKDNNKIPFTEKDVEYSEIKISGFDNNPPIGSEIIFGNRRSYKKTQFMLGHSEISKIFNGSQANILAMRLSFWLKSLTSFNDDVRNVVILSKGLPGIAKSQLNHFKNLFFKYIDSQIKESSKLENLYNKDKEILLIKIDNLQNLKSILDNSLKNFKEIQNLVDKIQGIDSSLDLNIFNEMITTLEKFNDFDEFDINELLTSFKDLNEFLSDIEKFKENHKQLNNKIDNISANSQNNIDSDLLLSRLDINEKDFLEKLQTINNEIPFVMKKIEEFLEKNIIIFENKINKNVKEVDAHILENNEKQKSLKLLLSNQDNILIMDHISKRDWEDKNKNLHDRVYFNDHAMVSWGKGFDIIDEINSFERRQANINLNSSIINYSIFDHRDRSKTIKHKEAISYAVFDKIADDIFTVIEEERKK